MQYGNLNTNFTPNKR